MYNWFQETWADFLRMREPDGVRQSGCGEFAHTPQQPFSNP
jgi:hypothetical protein